MVSKSSVQRPRKAKVVAAIVVAGGLIASASVAGAVWGFRVKGAPGSRASIRCAGGVSSLEHVFDESNSFFEGDPETHITINSNIPDDGFLVEAIEMGTHTGTHIDAPGHFIDGGRTVDELTAEELIMPAYVIDVRDRMAEEIADGNLADFQLTVDDIKDYEDDYGRIRRNSLVIIQTGFEDFFGTEAFDGSTPGFSGDAVQWLVDRRHIGGIGSDTYGPDATSDADYDATYTILLNDHVAVPGLNNVDSLARRGDVVILSPVRLGDGSGFQINPVACHGRHGGHNRD